MTLEILDAAGAVVRKYSSTDPEEPIDPNLAGPDVLGAAAAQPARDARACIATRGTCTTRRCPAAAGAADCRSPPIAHDTAPAPNSIWAAPGRYTVRLTVDGKSYTQPLTLKMDPRVKTPPSGLQQQFTLSKALYDDVGRGAEGAGADSRRFGRRPARRRSRSS